MDIERGEIERESVLRYLLAGKSTVTVENEETGKRFTYKVVDFQRTEVGKAENDPAKELWWVRVLTRPDNDSDASYSFIGSVMPNGAGLVFRLSKKSRVTEDALSVKAFSWLLRAAQEDRIPGKVHVYHEGFCGRCGRKLTVPESIKSGYGPECIQIMSHEKGDER